MSYNIQYGFALSSQRSEGDLTELDVAQFSFENIKGSSGLICPKPTQSPLKQSPGRNVESSFKRRLRLGKDVTDEAEKELNSILVCDNITVSSSSAAQQINCLESPEPRYRFSGSPFSPMPRAQNPLTSNSPSDDWVGSEGAELGLLAVSPPERPAPKFSSRFFGRVH